MNNVPDILAKIVEYKHIEVASLLFKTTIADLENLAKSQSAPRGFLGALELAATAKPALIAEIKKASPSKGLIREDFNPPDLAKSYEKGGATCLSILTDGPSFQGDNQYLIDARAAVSLPVIRKDFMIDIAQVIEARALGADAILIIMSCTDDVLAKELFDCAASLGMDSLIETHDAAEMERALKLGGKLIGVNNRNLRTFETRLETTEELAKMVGDDVFLVAESGIFTHNELKRLQNCGAKGFLVGESLMRQADVTKATQELLFGE
jgi:indole-3-glycerol phosphate synthase